MGTNRVGGDAGMAQTFDIRFARSAGFAALLAAPENLFRWKGGGLLRIDAQSISFTVKRSLLALFAGNRTRRIPAGNLKAVYREGDALRVEFQADEAAREVLPFWASDRDAAAEIVRLLPTRQTVELEHSTDATNSGTPRADWRAMLIIGVALAAIATGIWVLYPSAQLPAAATPVPVGDHAAPAELRMQIPMPDATASLDDSPAPANTDSMPEAPAATPELARTESALPDFLVPAPVVLPPLPPLPLPRDYVRSEDFVIPIARGTVARDVATRELAAFETEAAQLEAVWRLQRDLLNANALTPEDLATRLDEFAMRWWNMTFRIFDNEALANPALLDLRATMLATARLWRSFLSSYAIGLRERNHVKIANSFDDLARAQEMQSRARLFLR